ncbi:GNAT family N-acetyltransferase [Arthrobacter psychrolactophilus]
MQQQTPLSLVRAELSDAQPLWLLRRQLEDWIHAKGLNQWRPGEMPIETIRSQINAGEWYVHRHEDGVLAALRVLWSDAEFWGPDDTTSVYVHGLMADRGYSAQRFGKRLLDWATLQGAAKGRSYLRLDCAASNQDLCAFYASQGFTAVGEKKFENGLNDVILWQRPISL